MQPNPANPGLNPHPDPAPDQAAAPRPIARVLAVLASLIGFAHILAESARRQAAGNPRFADALIERFRTTDTDLIRARIARALMRLTALHALLSRRAARGRDLAPPPFRIAAPRAARTGPAAPRKPRPARPDELDPGYIPTEQEIAAEVRRRAPGAVIADICRDLGIMPNTISDPIGDELFLAVALYGGRLLRLFRHLCGIAAPAKWQAGMPLTTYRAMLSISTPPTGPPRAMPAAA